MNDDIEQRIKHYQKLWNEDHLSLGEISTRVGLSRGAIIGFIDRARKKGYFFETRQKKVRSQSYKARVAVAGVNITADVSKKSKLSYFSTRPVPKLVFKDPVDPVSLLEHQPWQCMAVIDTPQAGRILYCGKEKTVGSYCQDHAKVYYKNFAKN